MFDFIKKFFFGTQQETEKKTKFEKPPAYKNINSSQSQN